MQHIRNIFNHLLYIGVVILFRERQGVQANATTSADTVLKIKKETRFSIVFNSVPSVDNQWCALVTFPGCLSWWTAFCLQRSQIPKIFAFLFLHKQDKGLSQEHTRTCITMEISVERTETGTCFTKTCPHTVCFGWTNTNKDSELDRAQVQLWLQAFNNKGVGVPFLKHTILWLISHCLC